MHIDVRFNRCLFELLGPCFVLNQISIHFVVARAAKLIILNAFQAWTSARLLRARIIQLCWSSWLSIRVLVFVNGAWSLLPTPDLAWYPLHLRLLIVNRAYDKVSLRDFVCVRGWQFCLLGLFHDFGSVNEPIVMILLSLLVDVIVGTLLRPVGCRFIGLRPRDIVMLLGEDLAEHFWWRVRLFDEGADVIELGFIDLAEPVS